MALIFPDLFRPYVEGREAAIAANWADRDKFNKVRQGELENIFQGASMDARLRKEEGLARALETEDLFQTQTMQDRAAQERERARTMGAQAEGFELANVGTRAELPFAGPKAEANLENLRATGEATRVATYRAQQLIPGEVERVTGLGTIAKTEAAKGQRTLDADVAMAFSNARMAEGNARLAVSNANVAEPSEAYKIIQEQNAARASGLQVEALKFRNEMNEKLGPLEYQKAEYALAEMARNDEFGAATNQGRIKQYQNATGMSDLQLERAAYEFAMDKEKDPHILRELKAKATIVENRANVETLTSQAEIATKNAEAEIAQLQVQYTKGQISQQELAIALGRIDLNYRENFTRLDQVAQQFGIYDRINRGDTDPMLQQAVKDQTSWFWRLRNRNLSPAQQYFKRFPNLNPFIEQNQTDLSSVFGTGLR